MTDIFETNTLPDTVPLHCHIVNIKLGLTRICQLSGLAGIVDNAE